ncbi:MAG: acylphosphatase [Firmicutes bacterium ML8_F2]|jgi:acylphosphatase|nr:MAG: acylphosphatase [Firmicutes bacterium ML8_F2]
MDKRLTLKAYGRVQGVLFRDSTRRQAKKIGLTGWVSNQDDGTVKIVAEGKEEDLNQFIEWCYNGPILAKVDKIDIKWQKATGRFENFIIKY